MRLLRHTIASNDVPETPTIFRTHAQSTPTLTHLSLPSSLASRSRALTTTLTAHSEWHNSRMASPSCAGTFMSQSHLRPPEPWPDHPSSHFARFLAFLRFATTQLSLRQLCTQRCPLFSINFTSTQAASAATCIDSSELSQNDPSRVLACIGVSQSEDAPSKNRPP